MYNELIQFVRDLYKGQDHVPLHAPYFDSDEKELVNKCLDSTFVSSVGTYVNEFEKKLSEFTGVAFAIATTTGTSALHTSLVMAGVEHGDEVITQNITFVATANSIAYCGAKPILVDCDADNLALSPSKLENFLEENAKITDEGLINKITGKKIKACVVMHVFGHPAKMSELSALCKKYKLFFIEDAAESLGSYYKGKHTGHWGELSVLSFNGNKIITTGGGGAILTNDPVLAKRAKHLTTTARVAHQWEFIHDEVGFNYRLPNLNASLGCAQMEKLSAFIKNKREVAALYEKFLESRSIKFWKEDESSTSNYWLNAIVLNSKKERDEFLAETNDAGVMTRPLWSLISELPAFKNSQATDLSNSIFFKDRIVNLPSSVRVVNGKF